MRPTTNAEIATALRTGAQYATDSEGKWLMEEAARRLDEIAAPQPAGDSAAEEAEAPLAEQNAPADAAEPAPKAKPDRLPRAKQKPAEG